MIHGILGGDQEDGGFNSLVPCHQPSPDARHGLEQGRRVLGVARLISSARTNCAKAGGPKSKFGRPGIETEAPVMSLGKRSGCALHPLERTSTLWARARASMVLAIQDISNKRGLRKKGDQRQCDLLPFSDDHLSTLSMIRLGQRCDARIPASRTAPPATAISES